MAKIKSIPVVPTPAAPSVKHLSRGERIHRRRMLALKRRIEKAEAVTNPD